jgi:ubiquinone/menaquinone biosynthesis C-methylase UbiE
MSQKDVFLATEGDQYHRRNKDKFSRPGSKADQDRVVAAVAALAVKPDAVLEIGSGHGWRLEQLRTAYGATCDGIDPSAQAVADGTAAYPHVRLQVGTADRLLFPDCSFDLVVFGFCLYLCDRQDLFTIAAEADRVLRDGGHLVIEDFHPPFPYRNPYGHSADTTTYKMDYPRLFTGNPAYTLLSQTIFDHDGAASIADRDKRVAVTVLVKDMTRAYPPNPFTTA